MIINDLDGYYIVFDTKNWNTELDTLVIFPSEGKGTKTFPVKFKVLEFTDKLLKLQNTTTNVVNTYFAK